jgi:PEP-CTERM motif
MIKKLALALGLALGTAGSAMATTIDFESTGIGTYSGLTFGAVSISFLAGSGSFEVQNQTSAPPPSGHVLISYFTNPGSGSFQATFAGGANTVSIDVGDYSPSDADEVHLRAYDSLNNLLDTAFFLIPGVGPGTTLTVSSSTPIARVEWNDTGEFAGSVYWDNLSYQVAAVPEPSTWAMMILGFAGVGFMAYRRSRKDQGLALAAA